MQRQRMKRSVLKSSIYNTTRRQKVAAAILLTFAPKFDSISREKLVRILATSPRVFRHRTPSACALTGRTKGVLSFFKMSRFKVKKLAELGFLPGVQKLSW